jgi:hypothetical protein
MLMQTGVCIPAFICPTAMKPIRSTRVFFANSAALHALSNINNPHENARNMITNKKGAGNNSDRLHIQP